MLLDQTILLLGWIVFFLQKTQKGNEKNGMQKRELKWKKEKSFVELLYLVS